MYQGHTALLRCEAQGDPKPLIQWKGKDRILDPTKLGPRWGSSLPFLPSWLPGSGDVEVGDAGGQHCDFSLDRMHIFQNGSLVIHDVAPEDSGRYTCIAGNSCNIKHTEAPLYVVGRVGRGPAQGVVMRGTGFFSATSLRTEGT